MTSAYEKKDEQALADRMFQLDLEELVYGPADPNAATNPWPVLNNDALHGFAGEVVAALDPTTEADPAAVLFVFLAWAGCYLGGDAHLYAGNTPHPARLWPLLVGASSTGAKGTAVAAVNQFTRAVDLDFYIKNNASGLSSGEGLIHRVRNQRGDDPNDKNFDEGVADKRLFVNEPEFASVLARSRRDGNSLTMVVRNAYDGVPLQTITTGNPLYASDHHISVVGAITPGELINRMTDVDIANGFANRFMLVCSKKSKLLPDGGEPDYNEMTRLTAHFKRIAAKLREGRPVRRMHRTEKARELWHAEYHARHKDDLPDGAVASLRGRWHAHSTRLSVAYALLDGSSTVDVAHVRAGLAAWDYAEASIKNIFNDEKADPELGKLTEFVDNSEFGVTRQQIYETLFRKNKSRSDLDTLCEKLLGLGRYRLIKVPPAGGRGRPALFYVRVGRGAADPAGN